MQPNARTCQDTKKGEAEKDERHKGAVATAKE